MIQVCELYRLKEHVIIDELIPTLEKKSRGLCFDVFLNVLSVSYEITDSSLLTIYDDAIIPKNKIETAEALIKVSPSLTEGKLLKISQLLNLNIAVLHQVYSPSDHTFYLLIDSSKARTIDIISCIFLVIT